MKPMTRFLILFLLMSLFSSAQAQNGEKGASLLPELRTHLQQLEAEFDQIPQSRKAFLMEAAQEMVNLYQLELKLVYVCTHNSRRSQMAQMMAQAAASYYGVKATAFSAGTEITAFHPNAIEALKRVGFRIAPAGLPTPFNPTYNVIIEPAKPPVKAFSKKLHEEGTPGGFYVAIMVCDQADKECPMIRGSILRMSLPYVDPKDTDGKPEQNATYDARLREIGREQMFLLSEVARLQKS